MPRKPKWPPVPHSHRGRDRVRWAGREYYLGPTGSDEARQNYARLVAELAAGGAGRTGQNYTRPHTGPTVAEAVAAWVRAELPRYGADSKEPPHYRRALTVLVRLYGDAPARDFRARQLDAVRLSMASGGWMTDAERAEAARRGDDVGWCRNHTNRQTGRLRTVWRWCERQGWAPEGSWAHLRTLPGLAVGDGRARQTERRVACSLADLEAVAALCPPAAAAVLRVCWHSGARPGEVRTMRQGDLDRSGDVWLYRPRRHKNSHRGTSRAVALGPEARAVLSPFVAAAAGPDAYVFSPDGLGGRCYTVTGYCQAVRRAAERAGVVGLETYQARHAFRDRVTAALGLDKTRAAMGHSGVEQTASYGDAVDLKAAQEVARRLG